MEGRRALVPRSRGGAAPGERDGGAGLLCRGRRGEGEAAPSGGMQEGATAAPLLHPRGRHIRRVHGRRARSSGPAAAAGPAWPRPSARRPSCSASQPRSSSAPPWPRSDPAPPPSRAPAPPPNLAPAPPRPPLAPQRRRTEPLPAANLGDHRPRPRSASRSQREKEYADLESRSTSSRIGATGGFNCKIGGNCWIEIRWCR